MSSVEKAWFAQERLSEAVSRVWEPFVHAFFRANMFHVRGRDADLVIDFGMGIHSLRSFLAIDPGKPVVAVATHVHVDHVGSFHEFDDRLGHVSEAGGFAGMKDEETLAGYFRTQEAGVSENPGAGWQQEDYALVCAPLSRAVGEGDRIDIGNRSFTVLHLPGHSPGSIGLLDERDGMFFPGDAIYDGALVDDLPGCDKVAYRRTMGRLLEIDVSIAHGGHGEALAPLKMRDIARRYRAD